MFDDDRNFFFDFEVNFFFVKLPYQIYPLKKKIYIKDLFASYFILIFKCGKLCANVYIICFSAIKRFSMHIPKSFILQHFVKKNLNQTVEVVFTMYVQVWHKRIKRFIRHTDTFITFMNEMQPYLKYSMCNESSYRQQSCYIIMKDAFLCAYIYKNFQRGFSAIYCGFNGVKLKVYIVSYQRRIPIILYVCTNCTQCQRIFRQYNIVHKHNSYRQRVMVMGFYHTFCGRSKLMLI